MINNKDRAAVRAASINNVQIDNNTDDKGVQPDTIRPPHDFLDQYFAPEAWPAALPIKTGELPAVPPLQENLIPEPLRAASKDIAHRMQAPLEAVVCTELMVVLSLIGSRCRVRPKLLDNWTITPNTWGAIVDYPSKLKSPIIDAATSLLAPLIAKAEKVFTEQQETYQAEEAAQQSTRSAIKGKMQKAATKNVPLDDLIEDYRKVGLDKPPTNKRYHTQSATLEKLHELICENPRGMFIIADELVRLFKTWEKTGHEADRAFFMEGWAGGQPHVSDTIGRGTLTTNCLTISLMGGIQPDKLQGILLDAANGDDDGLVQRLQIAVFPDGQRWRYVDQLPNVDALNRVQMLLQCIDDIDYKAVGASFDDAGNYYFLRFSDEANAEFKNWLTILETQKLPTETNSLIRGHLAKYRSLMPSLALAFCLIRVADLIAKKQQATATITKEDAQNAADFCNYLEHHARKIYALVDNAKQKATHALSVKIQDGTLSNFFSLRDIYKPSWRHLKDKDLARAACDGLIIAGWLREVELPPSPKGGGASLRFEINPSICAMEGRNDY